MEKHEDEKPPKLENSSLLSRDQVNFHVYPDWAAMQAYYGPIVALAPYYGAAIASGHAPRPCTWGPPQPMMQPYGPYAAVCSPGSIYAPPAAPLGLLSNAHGISSSNVASESMVVAPLTKEIPGKSSGEADRTFINRLKDFDGLTMSIGNSKSDSAEDFGLSLSLSGETEGSTDASSDGIVAAGGQNGMKRSRGCTHTPTGEGKMEKPCNAAADKNEGFTVAPAGVSCKVEGMERSPSLGKLELKTSLSMSTDPSPIWLQDERELKRERRKQSNRESARRSRLRRQAEAEELAIKVGTLHAENFSLKSELTQLTETSEKLQLENTELMEKLKAALSGKTEGMFLDKVDNNIKTENLLSRVSNSGSEILTPDDNYKKNSTGTGTKPCQLLGAAMAAG